MTREELLAALTVERYTNPWWATPKPDDSETTCARRRKNLALAYQETKESVA